MDCYECLNFIDEGTYGLVFRARDIETGKIYALKQVKLHDKNKDGFPTTSLREIMTLFAVSHPNVVSLREIVVGSTLNKIYLVLEYADHDLLSILDRMSKPYSPSEVKSLMKQLLEGVQHLHDNWILHRDLKPANLLITNGGILKICDFGLARNYADPIPKYTQGVVTLWYRAPELLMGSRTYSTAIDVWSVGCIFVELLRKTPLWKGQGELDQLGMIAKILGRPCEERWAGFSELPNADRVSFRNCGKKNRLIEKIFDGVANGKSRITNSAADLMERMLCYDPVQRITADAALRHQYFTEHPPPKDPELIQSFPDDRRGQ